MEKGKRKSAKGNRINVNTIKVYSCIEKLLIEFEQINQMQICISLMPRYSAKQILLEKNYWKRFYQKFTAFLYKKGYYDGYVGSVWKSIKALINWIIREKALPIAPIHKWIIIPQSNFNPIVLSLERLHFTIYNEAFANNLAATLKRIRHIFIAGCTLGLRFSDLMNLKKIHLIQLDNDYYIQLYAQKTGFFTKIPVPAYLLEIFNLYKTKNSQFLLPQISNARFNILIKEVGEKAGWQEQYPKFMCKMGKWVELKKADGKSWKYYHHLSSHTMRRTAITSLLILGVPEQVVRKISGHAPGSKEFFKYVSIAESYLSKEVQQAQLKLKNLNTEKPS